MGCYLGISSVSFGPLLHNQGVIELTKKFVRKESNQTCLVEIIKELTIKDGDYRITKSSAMPSKGSGFTSALMESGDCRSLKLSVIGTSP